MRVEVKMKTPSVVLAGFALIFSGLAFSDAGYMPLRERVQSSAYIGLVDISATIPPSQLARGQGQPTSPYRQVAVGRVVRTVKGDQRPSDKIEVDFDTGLSCPNVKYEAGQRYLVFLARDGNGRYSTVNFGAGRYKVENGAVAGLAVEAEGSVLVDDVLAKLANMIKAEQ